MRLVYHHWNFFFQKVWGLEETSEDTSSNSYDIVSTLTHQETESK